MNYPGGDKECKTCRLHLAAIRTLLLCYPTWEGISRRLVNSCIECEDKVDESYETWWIGLYSSVEEGLAIVCNANELLIMCYCQSISYVTRLLMMIDWACSITITRIRQPPPPPPNMSTFPMTTSAGHLQHNFYQIFMLVSAHWNSITGDDLMLFIFQNKNKINNNQ